MKKALLKLLAKFNELNTKELVRNSETNLMLSAQLHIQRIKKLNTINSLGDVEFKVFSEWGEDGIIQYLINNVEIKNKTFIEFGVSDYKESITRFLLMNDLWKGLVIDSSAECISSIQKDEIYWRYNLKAINNFITSENINNIFLKEGFTGEIGLLSVDIDGNDYWVLEKIDVIDPVIIVCEYNSLFGKEFPVSIKYDPNFIRSKAHYSNLYFGASLPALVKLAEKKGYDFVGSNSAGSNAFFVKKGLSKNLKIFTAAEGYKQSQFRQSRDLNGNLTFLIWEEAKKIIEDMETINTVTGKSLLLKEVFESERS
jgi:hypothetical protein